MTRLLQQLDRDQWACTHCEQQPEGGNDSKRDDNTMSCIDYSHLSVVKVVVGVAAVVAVVVVAVALETLLTVHLVLRDTSDCRSLLHPQNPVLTTTH